MLPVQIAGLALAGRTLLLKHGGIPENYLLSAKNRKKYTLSNDKTKPQTFRLPQLPPFPQLPRLPQLPNPFEALAGITKTMPAQLNTLTKSLTGAVEQVKKSIAGEDYDKAIKSYLPSDARLVKPQYPQKSHNGFLLDLDGDSENELVASYKLKNELKTMVLKKQQNKWVKINEFTAPDFDGINYRGAADITGQGKKQLLLGLTSNSSKKAELRGYSFDRGVTGELFSRNYHKLEVLPNKPGTKGSTRIAIWNKETDSHKIEVLQWNGTRLEPLKDNSRYFLKRVVPYYVSRINSQPAEPVNWYNLAKALKNAGAKRDAVAAVNVAFKLSNDNSYTEKLAALKDEIEGKAVPAPKVENIAPVLPEAPVVKQIHTQPGIQRRPYPRY